MVNTNSSFARKIAFDFGQRSAQPLIDAWVKSGDTKEFRGTVRLLGGRGYPAMLVGTTAGQGVMKPAEEKAKQPIVPASISLAWIPPGQSEQIVSKQFLSPHHFPETYFVNTAFPPDDRSTGFERGSSVSKEWERATTDAAIEIADYVLLRLHDLTGGAQPGPDYESRLREFCRQFVSRAFRQPLNAEQASLYVDRQFEGAGRSRNGRATRRSAHNEIATFSLSWARQRASGSVWGGNSPVVRIVGLAA